MVTKKKAPVKAAKPTSTESKRRKAKPPMSQERFKLVVHNKKPGRFYYWADEASIPGLLERDYVFEQDPELKVGTDEQGDQSQTSAIKRSGGGGKTLYLMSIKQEWYDQDRAAEEDALKSHEKRIYNPTDEGVYVKKSKIRHGEDFED